MISSLEMSSVNLGPLASFRTFHFPPQFRKKNPMLLGNSVKFTLEKGLKLFERRESLS